MKITKIGMVCAFLGAATCAQAQDAMMDGKMIDGTMSMMPAMMMPAMMDGKMAGAKTFRVTIVNLTKGQPLSGPVFLTHSRALRLWQVGQKASFAIGSVAEGGAVGPVIHDAMMAQGGKAVGTITTQFGIMPGGSTSFLVTADDAHPLLSGATMLVNTNDGFTGLDSVNLLEMNGPRTVDVMGYDAGTEKNSERATDLVARMGPNRQNENGVITVHKGIRGDKDAPKSWNFSGAVARITIEPVEGDFKAAMGEMMMKPPMMKPMDGMMGGQMMMMMANGQMKPAMDKNGKMMAMPKDAKMVMMMPDGTMRAMMMKDGKMMVMMPDGSMAEVAMMDEMPKP